MIPVANRLRRDRRGATSLEFAMVALTTVVVLLAVFDLGLLFLARRTLDDGTNRAARWASVNGAGASAAAVLARFTGATSPILPAMAGCTVLAAGAALPAGSACGVSVGFSSGTAVGSVVTVQASYRWSPAGPVDGFVSAVLQSTVSLTIQR